MKFRNLKTCYGIESYLYFKGAWVRLSMLPELLRNLPKKEVAEIIVELEKLSTKPSSFLPEKSSEESRNEPAMR
jgi:hypothetical protein